MYNRSSKMAIFLLGTLFLASCSSEKPDPLYDIHNMQPSKASFDAPRGNIKVVSGTYGSNCGTRRGNATQDLANQCNGLQQCTYRVDYQRIGDPAVGCAKDYTAEWTCGRDKSHVLVAKAPPEAGFGGLVTLFCQGNWR